MTRNDPDEELECAHCGEPIADGDDESTYCGSMHQECVCEHAKECGACSRDWPPGDEPVA